MLFHAVTLTLENLKLKAVRLLVPPITRAENVGRGWYPQSIRVLVTFSVDFLGHETRLERLRELVREKRENILEDVSPPLALEVSSLVGRRVVHAPLIREAVLEDEAGALLVDVAAANGIDELAVFELDSELVARADKLEAVPARNGLFEFRERDFLVPCGNELHRLFLRSKDFTEIVIADNHIDALVIRRGRKIDRIL